MVPLVLKYQVPRPPLSENGAPAIVELVRNTKIHQPGDRRPEFFRPTVKKAKNFATDGENSQNFCLQW
jgi:hypothetical protein